jgi:hypothetical protein
MENPFQTAAQAGIMKPQDIPVTNPNNVMPAYSNFFGASATATDFTIFFMEVGQTPGPKGPIHRQEVKAMVTLPMMAVEGLRSVLAQVKSQTEEAIRQAQEAAASVKK